MTINNFKNSMNILMAQGNRIGRSCHAINADKTIAMISTMSRIPFMFYVLFRSISGTGKPTVPANPVLPVDIWSISSNFPPVSGYLICQCPLRERKVC